MFSMYEDADREEEWEGPEDQILHPWWSSRLQIFTQERTNHLKLSYIKIDIRWSCVRLCHRDKHPNRHEIERDTWERVCATQRRCRARVKAVS